MKVCIFCKIVDNEIDSAKIWEDREFLAILDLNPNTKGMTLILTKEHFGSDIFEMPEEVYKKMMMISRKVAKLLEKALNVQRVAMVLEGLGVNHAHAKLYPLYGLNREFDEMLSKEKIFFNKYEGYITTQLGPKADISELKKLAKKIKMIHG